MRKFRIGVVGLGLALAACGGNDFQAAEPEDGGSSSPDASSLAPDARSGDETSQPDAAGEWHGDDGVPDANGERVVDDATSVEAAFDAPPDGPPDASRDVVGDAPVVGTCDAPLHFYRDRDRDGYGSTDNGVVACTAPAADDGGAWVTQPGDCRDDLADVKPFKQSSPDPPNYSGTGYPDPVRPLGISFDYDCNGDETADPTNQFGAAPTCPALATGCAGTGYVPASPARSGTGVNPLCGSTTLKSCVVMGLNCKEQYIQMSTPFRCR
jgi:hypothetical protein